MIYNVVAMCFVHFFICLFVTCWNVFGGFWQCFGNCLEYVLDMFWTCFEHVLGMFWHYFGNVLGRVQKSKKVKRICVFGGQ